MVIISVICVNVFDVGVDYVMNVRLYLLGSVIYDCVDLFCVSGGVMCGYIM